MRPQVVLTLAVVTLAISLAIAAPATAGTITYAISQGGWTGGGVIEGIFTGEDLNRDGYIDRASGEVADYRVTFSGNAAVPAFAHFLGSVQFLRYRIGTFGIPPSAPLFSSGSGVRYDGDDGVIATLDGTSIATTERPARVSRAPEPSGAAMIALGLGAGGWIGRARRRRSTGRAWMTAS